MDGLENVAGVEAQEVTEPVTTEVTENPTAKENTTTDNNAEVQTEAEPTKTEEDSRFANVRRKAEEEARIKYEAEQAKVNNEVKRLFGSFTNPVTNKPIENMMDYLQAIEAQQKQQREEELRAKGIDPSIIDELINNSPAVRQANEVMQMSMQAEAKRKFAEDLKIVSDIDPSIKNENDLVNHPSYQQVCSLVQNNGLSLPDAYRLANYNTLTANNNAAAKQAAINQAKGKNHLESAGNGLSSNSKLVDVPESTLRRLREFYPDATDQELKEKYNSTL